MIQNFSFDRIEKIFEERRTKNRHLLNERKAKVYKMIPEYESLDTPKTLTSEINIYEILAGNKDYANQLKSNLMHKSEQKAKLLTEYGFPSDYLEPIYSCTDCKDTGYIDTKKCHCYKDELLRMMYKQSNLERILNEENFNTFNIEYYPDDYIVPDTDYTPRDFMRSNLDICHEYINNFENEHGNLLIYGRSGVGKTFLTNCIAKEILDAGYSVLYLTSHELFDILETKVFHREKVDDMIESVVSMLYTCDLLIIDDLGTEMINSFTESQLFSCIQRRLLAQVGTIISTNFSFDDIINHYSERIFSRLFGNYTLIKIVGDDIRIKKDAQ